MLRLRPARMRFEPRSDIPDHDYDTGKLMPPMHAHSIADDREEAWWTVRDRLTHPINREHKALGYLETPNGLHGRCWRRMIRPEGTWRHLWTFGYDTGVGFEVADAGRLQLAISPNDLRGGRFDRVCGIFDSA